MLSGLGRSNTMAANPFGKVRYREVEKDSSGNEIRRRAGTATDLTPYAEFIKEQRAANPDAWIILDFPTGTIIKKGDTGATKKSVGRGKEEWMHASRFERAAKEVLDLGQPTIDYIHNVPETDDDGNQVDADEVPTTTLSMRFYDKRTYTPEQELNRKLGQAQGRVTRAVTTAQEAKAVQDADPENAEKVAAYKAAAARLTTARKSLKELTNGS
jgi:hypothetical protein